jgi:hypothetical protein
LRSRSSIAALRAVLQNYQVPPESEVDPYQHIRHGHGHISSEEGSEELVSELYLDHDHDHDRHATGSERAYTRSLEGRSMGLRSAFEDGNEMMDALVDIHRVLYRGRENVVDLQEDWDSEDVGRVVDRWFEGDCSEFLFLPLSFSSSLPALFSFVLNEFMVERPKADDSLRPPFSPTYIPLISPLSFPTPPYPFDSPLPISIPNGTSRTY